MKYKLECFYTADFEVGKGTKAPDDANQSPWYWCEENEDESGTYWWVWSYTTFSYTIPPEFMNGILNENINAISNFQIKLYRECFDGQGNWYYPQGTNGLEKLINNGYETDDSGRGFVTDKELWDNIAPFRTSCRLWKIEGNEETIVFEGRFADVEEVMESDGKYYKLVTVESFLGILQDAVVDGYEILEMLDSVTDTDSTFYKKYWSQAKAKPSGTPPKITPEVLFYALMFCQNEEYGAGLPVKAGDYSRRFGYETNSYWVSRNNLKYSCSDATTNTLDLRTEIEGGAPDTVYNWLTKIFVDKLGFSIYQGFNTAKSIGSDGHLTLSIAKNETIETLGQPITLGKNMKSLKIRSVFVRDKAATALKVYGGKGKDGKRITIESIEQTDNYGWETFTRKHIEAGSLAYTYGQIETPYVAEEYTDNGQDEAIVEDVRGNLYRSAHTQAATMTDKYISIEVDALDLKFAGVDVEEFTVGKTAAVTNSLLDMSNAQFKIIGKKTDLAKPWNAQLTFGNGIRGMTSAQARQTADLHERIHKIENMLAKRLDHTAIQCHDPDDPGAILTAEVFAQMLANRGD